MDKVEKIKAEDLIARNRVFKLHDGIHENYFLVKGKTDDYLVVLPRFCSCHHFQTRCIKIPGKICYHLLAAKLCQTPLTIDDLDVFQYLGS